MWKSWLTETSFRPGQQQLGLSGAGRDCRKLAWVEEEQPQHYVLTFTWIAICHARNRGLEAASGDIVAYNSSR